MALEQTVKDLQVQNAQFQEMFTTLAQGQKDLKELITKKNLEDSKDRRFEPMQAEITEMRIQMMGQMALIQNLARGQEELRILINEPLKFEDNQMVRTTRVGNPSVTLPPIRSKLFCPQERGKSTLLRQQQQGNHPKKDTPRRQFSNINMPLSQALQHMLKAEFITLKNPPQHVNTSSPKYNPNVRCAYHSNSPGHDTDECWALKNKIQDLINERVLNFTQDGQIELFYHPSNIGTAGRAI